MLQKSTRKKINDHDWLYAAKQGGNESGMWSRHRRQVTTAVSDMVLLCEKMPKDKRDELFNLQNFKDLFNILIFSKEPTNDLVKLEIANYLVSKSILHFQILLMHKNENTPALTSVINDYLKKAIDICKDITYRERLNAIENSIPQKGLVYLGSWNELIDREQNNLRSFISDISDKMIGVMNLEMSYDKKEISGEGVEYYSDENYNIKLTLSAIKDKADLLISNDNGVVATYSFIVRSDIYDSLLYYYDSDIKKYETRT